jgi:hypothetical protein
VPLSFVAGSFVVGKGGNYGVTDVLFTEGKGGRDGCVVHVVLFYRWGLLLQLLILLLQSSLWHH